MSSVADLDKQFNIRREEVLECLGTSDISGTAQQSQTSSCQPGERNYQNCFKPWQGLPCNELRVIEIPIKILFQRNGSEINVTAQDLNLGESNNEYILSLIIQVDQFFNVTIDAIFQNLPSVLIISRETFEGQTNMVISECQISFMMCIIRCDLLI